MPYHALGRYRSHLSQCEAENQRTVPCRTRKLCGSHTLALPSWGDRVILEGHSSSPKAPCSYQGGVKGCKMPVCHQAPAFSRRGWVVCCRAPLPMQFLTPSHLLCVLQALCQALEQLPFSSSRHASLKRPSPVCCWWQPMSSNCLMSFCPLLTSYSSSQPYSL